MRIFQMKSPFFERNVGPFGVHLPNSAVSLPTT